MNADPKKMDLTPSSAQAAIEEAADEILAVMSGIVDDPKYLEVREATIARLWQLIGEVA